MTTNDDERVQPTPDDWQKLCEIEVLPEVLTEDALQKALGPEHVSVSADKAPAPLLPLTCTFTFALDGSARTRTPSGLSLGRAVRCGRRHGGWRSSRRARVNSMVLAWCSCRTLILYLYMLSLTTPYSRVRYLTLTFLWCAV